LLCMVVLWVWWWHGYGGASEDVHSPFDLSLVRSAS